MHSLDVRRRWSAIAAMGIAGFVAATAWSESYPYTARIIVPAAQIQSGPGDSFYATDTLTEGQEVEVYRGRQDGWCAIRPPEESFSWVFSSHLRLLGDSLAEIDKDDVASRIGSRISKRRNAVQVRLQKGELVLVVGEASEKGEKWYKIAPPAGEFRWIKASNIRPVDQLLEQETQGEVATTILTTSATDESPAEVQSSTTAPASSVATGNDWRATPIAPPLATADRSDSTMAVTNPREATANTSAAPAVPATVASPSPAQATSPAVDSMPSAARATLPPTAGAVSEDLARQLTNLELRLSRMVSEPPVTWQTAPLVNDAKRLLLAHAQAPADRTAVQVTLDKVERFATIQQRYQQIAARTSLASASKGATADITPIPPGSDPTTLAATPEAGRYDAVGVLRPVVSKRPGAPQFALVDGRGQVVSFVSATPDVNLQPYLGRRVGVVGNRGFIPEFHRTHVTAGRVMPLEERALR